MWVSKAARKRGREAHEQPRLRTHADLAATAARLAAAKLSKAALADEMTAAGINALTCVLQPDRIPHSDSVRDKPPDVMHVYGAGISRIESAHALEILFNEKSGLAVKAAWSKLNDNVQTLNARLPRGKRIPKIHPQRKGKKRNEQHLDVNASEALLFITHCHTLIEPLLTDKGRVHPCWLSLIAHAAVVTKALQHVFGAHEADELATLIEKHLEAFEAVNEYYDLDRPKHHFQEHLPAALLMFGPFRGFWCFPFEAFLQVLSPPPCESLFLDLCARSLIVAPSSPLSPPQLIKKVINMSNFAAPAFHVCHFWSMRSGLLLAQKDSAQDILDDHIEYSSNQSTDLSEQRIAQSRVLSIVHGHEEWQSVFATRNVRSFERGSLEVRSNDWVLVAKDGSCCVGRVGEIVELMARGGSFIRLQLRDARPIGQFNEMHGQSLCVSLSVKATEYIVNVEATSFHEVCCDDQHEGELRFTYIY